MKTARLRDLLLRHALPGALVAFLVPLLLGLLLSGPLLEGRERAAADLIMTERAASVRSAVEGVRSGATSALRALLSLPPGGPSGSPGPQRPTSSAARTVLSGAGWQVLPGVRTLAAGGPVLPTPSGQTPAAVALPPGFTRAMLRAADQRGLGLDIAAGPPPLLLVAVAVEEGGVLLASRPADAVLARALGADAGVGAALYGEGERVATDPSPLGSLLPTTLDRSLVDRVVGEERPATLRLGARGNLLAAVTPLKDFEAWDVVGVVAVAAPLTGIEGIGAGIGTGARLFLIALWAAAGLLLAAALVPMGRRVLPGWLAILPVASAAIVLRGRLQDTVRGVLEAGPPPVRELLGAGGLVERFTFGAELALMAGVVLLGLWLALVLVTARNVSRPRVLRTTWTAWAFLAPALAGLLLFFLGPMLFAAYISLHTWSIVEPSKPFVGLAHYAELLSNADFLHALWTAFLYTLHVPVSMALALGLALLLNRPLRGVGLFRTLFFLPSITSFVAIAMVWEWIYNPDFGLANRVLQLFGLPPSGWLTDPGTALPGLMIMAIWIGVGYQMVIFLAGLQGIPRSLHEAAIMDGAGPVRRFFKITLPLLRPTTLFVLVTSVIGSFQVFTQIYIMTDGGPVRATDVVVYHIYTAAWDSFRMGEAAAMSWILFAILLIVTLVQFRFVGRGETYGT